MFSSMIADDDCRKIKIQQKFDISQYLGVWYELARSKSMRSYGGDYATNNYALMHDGSIQDHMSSHHQGQSQRLGGTGLVKMRDPNS